MKRAGYKNIKGTVGDNSGPAKLISLRRVHTFVFCILQLFIVLNLSKISVLFEIHNLWILILAI